MRTFAPIIVLMFLAAAGGCAGPDEGEARGGGDAAGGEWRSIPLLKDAVLHPAWRQAGYGRMVVERDGSLRTECDPRGLGLLVYTAEALGDCQIRVVYRSQDPKSNSGVFVRVDEGILKRLDEPQPPATRNPDGSLSPEGLDAMKRASEAETGSWYAVHHGYEVQIADAGDELHRTGAVYSFTRAAAAPEKPRDQWREMVITLDGEVVRVDVDGTRVSEFDAQAKDLPPRNVWYEPSRDHRRPTKGYFGLQTHDPGDTVYFKEVGVRPLPGGRDRD